MTLGRKIQEIRVSRGMSQEEFGEMLGATRQTVSKWELDQAVPDIRKIVAISRLFCVSTDDLLVNVTNFEKEGVRFVCGIYRKGCCENRAQEGPVRATGGLRRSQAKGRRDHATEEYVLFGSNQRVRPCYSW